MSAERTDLSSLRELLDIMARLRDPASGCPWDRAQTFTSIAPHTLEEAYETVEAIERGAHEELCDELGDLLFQVVFYAEMAREAGWFDFAAIARAISDKLIRRHPHVFGGSEALDAPEHRARWEEIKRAERNQRGTSGALSGVPVGLAALTRAVKLGSRAAEVGFDWPDSAAVRAKVDEELAEVDSAIATEGHVGVDHEIGDLLLAVANLARHLGIDPEGSLRRANRRFESRFRRVEQAVSERAGAWTVHTAAELEALWQQAKRDEEAGP
jgi:ATP diphosphatase